MLVAYLHFLRLKKPNQTNQTKTPNNKAHNFSKSLVVIEYPAVILFILQSSFQASSLSAVSVIHIGQ